MALYERKGNRLERGLIAHYPLTFRDLGNNVSINLAKKNNTNGTITGAIPGVDFRGDEAGATSFDGVDDYVEIPHNAAQLGANLANGFTISVWINVKSQGESGGRFLDKSTTTTGGAGFYFRIATSDRLALQINSGPAILSAVNPIVYGTWYHVLVTVSSAQLVNFYVNATLNGTADQDAVQAISTITTTNDMRIGNRSGATDRTFDGLIQDVKMWNRVLTSAEIKELYNSRKRDL